MQFVVVYNPRSIVEVELCINILQPGPLALSHTHA